MEHSHVIMLLKLCQEISTIHEIPLNHEYSCPAERLKHEVYKFHLGVDSELDTESLEKLCEDFRNCYLFFVMSVKQVIRPMQGLVKDSAEDYLTKLLRETVRFVEEIASEMEDKAKVVNVGKLCEVIDLSQEISISLQSFVKMQIEKEIEQMQSAVEDLESEGITGEIFRFCVDQAEYWKNVSERIGKEIDPRHGEVLIAASKDVSKNIDFVVCYVSYI